MKRVIAVHALFDRQLDGPVYVCMCVYMYRYACVYICTGMHVCIMYRYACVYICTGMYVYIVTCLMSWY